MCPLQTTSSLGTSLAASVDEAQQAKVDLAKKTADLNGLLQAIIKRKRIDMGGVRYNVWCEGEAAGLGEPQDGVYVLETKVAPTKWQSKPSFGRPGR